MPGQCNKEHILNYLDIFQDYVKSISSSPKDLDSSFVPPTGIWSSEEKDVFFHAMAIHSRLRPDLIAAALPKKKVADVCSYISMLEKSLAAQPVSIRNNIPAAFEVSEKWLEKEDGLAEALIKSEARRDREGLHKLRKSRLDTVVRVVKAEMGGSTREMTVKEQKQAREKLQQQYALEDAMSSLGDSHLKVLDRMLDEGAKENVVVPQADEKHSIHIPDNIKSPDPATTHDLSSTQPQRSGLASTTDTMLIDPALLAISTRPTLTSIMEPQYSSVISFPWPDSSLGAPTAPNPFDEGSQPVASTSAVTLDHVPGNGTEVNDLSLAKKQAKEILATLSPTSKKQYRNMMNQRFRRAKLHGTPVSLDLQRFKPGPPKQSETRQGSYKRKRAEEDVNEDKRDEKDQPASKKQRPKVFLRNMVEENIKKVFENGHVNPAVLREEHLDLFHLANLEQLMQLYNRVYDAPSDVNTHISSKTLKLFNALVSVFVTDLVKQTIVCRETEIQLKGHTKYWGLQEGQKKRTEIPASSVHQAVELLGVRSSTKKQHFAPMFAALQKNQQRQAEEENESDTGSSRSSSESDSASEPSKTSSQDDEEDDIAGEGKPAALGSAASLLPSLHRLSQSPFVWLPPSYSSSRRRRSADLDSLSEDDEMSVQEDENVDEDVNISELEKEEEQESLLDQEDMATSKAHERGLWRMLKLDPETSEDEEEEEEDGSD